MDEGSGHAYGLGLSRDAHIAFAAAYVAALLTIGAFGAFRFAAQMPSWRLPDLGWGTRTAAPLAERVRPVPDPAYPHTVSIYPHVALLNHQEGTVVLSLLILPSGEVGDVDVIRSSGYPQLDAAALLSAGNWRYLPAVRNGAPVSAEVKVAIRFKLDR